MRRPGSREKIVSSVPEAKTVKNGAHLDLRPDNRDAQVERLLGLGTTHVEIGWTGTESWVVLADPEATSSASCRARGSAG